MIKYYFVNSSYTAYGSDPRPQTFVCAQHPFIEVNDLNKTDDYETTLLSWQEITKDEYDLYIKLNDGED